MMIEAAAANAYWAAWENMTIRFARKDAEHVPEHWVTFGKRSSLITSQPRLATNPANAILNYLYSLLEGSARLACLAVGLDPGIGALHADQKMRDSLALDIMEVTRPTVDAYVLSLLRSRVFAKRDFHETPLGVCRILTPLTHHLTETIPQWSAAVAPIAERVAKILAEAPGSKIRRIPTPLTGANRRAGGAAIRRRSKATVGQLRIAGACESCGVILKRGVRRYCDTCRPERTTEVLAALQTSGRVRLTQLRAQGRDPSATARAREKQAARFEDSNLRNAIWNLNHEPPDPSVWTDQILPGIQRVPLSRLASAMGVSKGYASRVRRGLVPAPRHWDALRALDSRTTT